MLRDDIDGRIEAIPCEQGRDKQRECQSRKLFVTF